MRTSTLLITAAAVLVAAFAGTLDLTSPPPAGPAPGAVSDMLAALPVRPEDTTAPYDRDAWGGWAGHGNGCDTRELVLTHQGHGVLSGEDCRPVCPATGPACWHSPYDRQPARDPARVHLDHRVPLAEAARSGAAGWTREQRERFYNDVSNLVAVSAGSNTSKGDDDPAHWRPTNRSAWCDYATAYVTAKDTYDLSVDPAERDALAAMLATCSGGGA